MATSTATVLSLIAWSLPTPPVLIVACISGLASAFGPQWLRIVVVLLAVGMTFLTVPFQSASGALLLLALAALLIALAVIDLTHASRSIRVLASAVAVTEICVVLWQLSHIG